VTLDEANTAFLEAMAGTGRKPSSRLLQGGPGVVELSRSEVQLPVQRRWMGHVAEVAEPTLFPQAGTWYTGANVPGKRRQFLPHIGGAGPFRALCDDVAASGYRGFSLA
jgi:hypothetical protein